jgi:small-conductance mechanosensitive channel/CRP-like cAMP-binding protein
MQEQLKAIVPHIQNATVALAILFFAYLLTAPLRRRYPRSDGVSSAGRRLRPFLIAVRSYPAFSTVVLLLSSPGIHWLYRSQERPYGQAWLLFWGICAVVRLVEGLLVEGFAQMGRSSPLDGLTRALLRLSLMTAVAFLLIRYHLGHEIGVLSTSTAIVTGVIGYAMKGVLGNLLAGMSLYACRSMAVGDWVEIDGLVAQVIHVNWRETRVRSAGHIRIIPNARVAAATIRNFSIPNTLRRHDLIVSVGYGEAPDDVIATLLEAAGTVPEVEKQPAPDAYITGFKDYCIQYVLRFWSRHYEFSTIIQGHVMRMVWYKFNRRGIQIPFPMSGRMLHDFIEAVHPQEFDKPPPEVDRIVDDMLRSDLGRKLLADSRGVCILSRDELRTVAHHVKRTRFTYGETLMCQGEDGESFYILIRGTVHGSIMNPDAPQPVEFDLHPGALFGEMSMLTGQARNATMTASTDCELLEFDRAAFARLLAMRREIPQMFSDLATARAAQNAASLARIRASAVLPPELACDRIPHRPSGILGEWKER